MIEKVTTADVFLKHVFEKKACEQRGGGDISGRFEKNEKIRLRRQATREGMRAGGTRNEKTQTDYNLRVTRENMPSAAGGGEALAESKTPTTLTT